MQIRVSVFSKFSASIKFGFLALAVFQIFVSQKLAHGFYSAPFPKSLGREWYHKHFDDDLKSTTNVRDALRTSVEHISDQIAAIIKNLSNEEPQKLFITGGGAYNRFLIETLQKKLPPQVQIVIPDATQINFKEAIIFAFLAYLRIQNKNNVLASVTGAQMDHCSGDVYGVW